jgi:hypothetical protein
MNRGSEHESHGKQDFEELFAELELELKRRDSGHLRDAIASFRAFVEETFG